MFDMVRATGDARGYQLRITYDSTTQKYYVVGYIRYEVRGGVEIENERDGGPIVFATMQDAIDHIVKYSS